MKRASLRRRLSTWLLLQWGLLLAAAGLAWWIADLRANAQRRVGLLATARERVLYDLLLFEGATRGLALDPTGETEQQRRREALVRLEASAELLASEFPAQPELLRPFEEIRRNWMEPAEPHPPTADFYAAVYHRLDQLREPWMRELTRRIEQVRGNSEARAGVISLAGAAGLLTVLLMAALAGRQHWRAVTRPLRGLAGEIDLLRQGDLTRRPGPTGDDEFGAMHASLHGLADGVSELARQARSSGAQVETITAQLAGRLREQQTAAREIATAAGQVGGGANELAAAAGELSGAMSGAGREAEEAAQLASQGQAASQRLEATLRQIRETSSLLTARLGVLGEKAAQINGVLATIIKVADQTNLLSLNAAIEAEKAGEYGLGFAVVAMEIRRLADQTAVATCDIERMLKEMQTALTAGAMGLDRVSEEVQRGAGENHQMSDHLGRILSQARALGRGCESASQSWSAQADCARKVQETLSQIGAAARQSAEALQPSSLALEQLGGVARALEAGAARFKRSG